MIEKRNKIRADLIFDPEKCIGCGACTLICPQNAVHAMKDRDYGNINFDYSHCIYCRRCSFVCPEDAIRYTGAPEDGNGAEQHPEVKFAFEYQKCRECGNSFLPQPLVEKVGEKIYQGDSEAADILALCPECRPRVMYQRYLASGKKK